MPVSTEPTTFDYACSWLVSSQTFCQDAMGSTAPDLDTMRSEAMARIYEEEALDTADDEEESETAPDAPPSISPRPRTIVRTDSDTRKVVGTATCAGSGTLSICVEVPVPEEFQQSVDLSNEENAAVFAARKQWARRLCQTIRNELVSTRGQGDAQGNPYLNAMEVDLKVPPADPEPLEGGLTADWIGWIYEVTWKG